MLKKPARASPPAKAGVQKHLKILDSGLRRNDAAHLSTFSTIRRRNDEMDVKAHSSTHRKLVIATYGSRGDVQPLLALALALEKRGHEVLLAGPPEYAEWVESYGCAYRAFGRNFKEFAKTFPEIHTVRAAVLMVKFLRRGKPGCISSSFRKLSRARTWFSGRRLRSPCPPWRNP